MARYIQMNEQAIEDARKEFEEFLEKGRFADGKISYTKEIGKIVKTTNLWFTETAWLKMRILIDWFDKEVGWHGVAYRQDGGYIITDILVYPQQSTSATVNTDRASYDEWLANLDDDTFKNLRFQGHSHVNMGTSPSGTDEKDQKEWLDMLGPDMFYIFVIANKKNSMYVKIYDLAENICYESSDVVVSVIPNGHEVLEFLEESKGMVKDKVYTPAVYSGTAKTQTTTSSGGSKYTYSTKNAAAPHSNYWDDDDDYLYGWRNR